jgi:hypothetical protein
MKQSIDKCLAEYTTEELIQFHANLNALFLCCTEDFHLMPLLMQVHFTIAGRKERLAQKYLKAVSDSLQMPEDYKYKNSPIHGEATNI